MHFKSIQRGLLTAAILAGLIFAPCAANSSPKPRSTKTEVSENKNKSKLEKLCFQEIIEKQFSLHESMQVQDVYKLLYQAEFGAEHMVHDTESALEYFEQEYSKTEPNEKEELLEQISPDGKIYRVNIGAYKARFDDKGKEEFFEVFIESSEKIKGSGSLQGLIGKWQEFKDINSQKKYFSKQQVELFEHSIIMSGFPFVSHSSQYKARNKPAYRVAHIDIIRKYLPYIFSDGSNGTNGTDHYDVQDSDPTAHPDK